MRLKIKNAVAIKDETRLKIATGCCIVGILTTMAFVGMHMDYIIKTTMDGLRLIFSDKVSLMGVIDAIVLYVVLTLPEKEE